MTTSQVATMLARLAAAPVVVADEAGGLRRTGSQITRRRPIAERRATDALQLAGYARRGARAPYLPSAQAGRWVRIFPVCCLPGRFRTCLRRERDRQAQTGARHRQVR